jgi:NTE family protein
MVNKEEHAAMAERALVLGGGGPVGIAWESGLLAGLAEAGADFADADFILGTSAGSFVGARLATGVRPGALAEAQIAQHPQGGDRTERAAGAAAPRPPDLTVLLRKMMEAASGQRPAEEVRAEIGAWALEANTITEDQFIASFGRSFAESEHAWPAGFACTAVDAATGAFRVWNEDSGVDLRRAVASSCSVPGIYPPITIGGRRYIDGGMRSSVSADLAAGHRRVLVIAVRVASEAGGYAERLRAQLDRELDAVRAGGGVVELVTPDEASVEAFGPNLMDARRRPLAAEAGLAQGRGQGARLAKFWKG